jgi:hypothetical protein
MRILLIFIQLTLFISLNAQHYLDEIAKQTCECAKDIPDTLSGNEFNMKLGLCVINAAAAYKDDLFREHQIDFMNIDVQGAQLGKLVGVHMINYCPDLLIRAANNNNLLEDEDESEVLSFEGTVTKIDDKGFVVFSVRDISGKLMKFYWLTPVATNIEIEDNYKTLLSKKVTIVYYALEFFDPRIKEYRPVQVIEEIWLLDE